MKNILPMWEEKTRDGKKKISKNAWEKVGNLPMKAIALFVVRKRRKIVKDSKQKILP